MKRTGVLAGWVALGALTAAAAWLRLVSLDTTPLHFDALHPYYQALRILHGHELPWRGTGGGFHFGALQAWVSVPLVVLGGSLRQVLGLNGLVHALGTLPLGLAGRHLGGWPAGLAAAGLYAAWPILVAHPHHGGFTYQAPVAIALAAWWATQALGAGRRRHVLGLALALAVAVHLHPYALAPAAAALVLVPSLERRHGRATVIGSALAGALVLAPMVVDNLQLRALRLSRDGHASLLQDAEMAARPPLSVLWDAARQGGAGWPQEAVLAVLVGPLVAVALALLVRPRAPAGPFALWTGTSLVALLGLSASLGYAQPYHLAVVLPLGFCLVGWALGALPSRMSPWISAATSALVLLGGGLALARTAESVTLAPALSQRHLGTVEEVTDVLLADAAGRPRTLALVAESSVVSLGDNVAWHLEQWTRGEPDSAFPAGPGFNRDWPRAYVVAELSPQSWDAWPARGRVLLSRTTRGDTELRLLVFASLPDAARWMRQACPLREGGLDLRVAPPRESLGGIAGDPEPHVALEWWAEPCPHKTDERWL